MPALYPCRCEIFLDASIEPKPVNFQVAPIHAHLIPFFKTLRTSTLMLKTLFIVSLFLLLTPYWCLTQVSTGWFARYNVGLSGNTGLAVTIDDSGFVYATGSSTGSSLRREFVVLKYTCSIRVIRVPFFSCTS